VEWFRFFKKIVFILEKALLLKFPIEEKQSTWQKMKKNPRVNIEPSLRSHRGKSPRIPQTPLAAAHRE
jgi:hypothetical protein